MLLALGDLCNKSPDSATERDYMLRLLNQAATILWPHDDMPMSLRSEYIIPPTTNTLCFPEYVGQLRGVRRCNVPISQRNLAARFVRQMPSGCYMPAILQRSAISDNTVDFSNLRIEFAEAVTDAAVVTVTGNTTSATNQVVVVRFGRGERLKNITASFVGISSVYKDILTGGDMRIMSEVSSELALVPSNAHTSTYLVYQLSEACECTELGQQACFELLYKPTLVPLSADSDVFQAVGVDLALVYYAAGLHKIRSGDREALEQAKNFSSQALAILQAANRDDGIGKEHPVGIMRPGAFPKLRNIGAYWGRYSNSDYSANSTE